MGGRSYPAVQAILPLPTLKASLHPPADEPRQCVRILGRTGQTTKRSPTISRLLPRSLAPAEAAHRPRRPRPFDNLAPCRFTSFAARAVALSSRSAGSSRRRTTPCHPARKAADLPGERCRSSPRFRALPREPGTAGAGAGPPVAAGPYLELRDGPLGSPPHRLSHQLICRGQHRQGDCNEQHVARPGLVAGVRRQVVPA